MIRKLLILWFIAVVPVILAACDSTSTTGSSTASSGKEKRLAKEKREKKEVAATEIRIKGIEDGLKHYSTKHDGDFPHGNGTEILDALASRRADKDGKPNGPWIEEYLDAWGNKFNYDWNTKTLTNSKNPDMVMPAIWSNGPNGKNENGAGDDIANWQKKQGR